MRWFTTNPVLMGCLPPVLLYLGIGVAVVLTRGLIGQSQAALFVLAYPFYASFGMVIPVTVIWLIVVWAVYFGRRRS